jgi:hypothetical protein
LVLNRQLTGLHYAAAHTLTQVDMKESEDVETQFRRFMLGGAGDCTTYGWMRRQRQDEKEG